MNLPSRGARESVTTTRYRGRLLEPSRRSRIDTATSSPPESWKTRKILHPAQLAFHAFELLHHLLELRVLLEEPVDVLHGRAAAARDALAPRSVDDVRMPALARRHRGDDGVEAVEVGLLAVEVLGARALEHLAEGQHAHDLVQRTHLAQLRELLAEILQREGVLAELAHHLLRLVGIDARLRLLHQRQHVAHAEDARGEAIGMEGLQRVGLLAHAH